MPCDAGLLVVFVASRPSRLFGGKHSGIAQGQACLNLEEGFWNGPDATTLLSINRSRVGGLFGFNKNAPTSTIAYATPPAICTRYREYVTYNYLVCTRYVPGTESTTPVLTWCCAESYSSLQYSHGAVSIQYFAALFLISYSY